MRGGKSLLMLLVVALGLGAYIYFVESKRDPADADKKARVFTVEAPKIEELEIRAASGETTTLKKTGDKWALVTPVATAADDQAVGSIVDAIVSLEIDKILDENPSSVTPFGLEHPRYAIAYKATGDTTLHRLNVGSKTPTGADVYARVEGQNRLFLTLAVHDDTFNRTSFDLRDKRVLAFSRDAVDSVALAGKGAPAIALARTAGDWHFTAPVQARADFSPVDGLIGRLDQVHMGAIVSEGVEPTPAQLKSFGLDAPQMIATVGSGSSKATLAIGAKKDDAGLYARDLSRPIIFTVEPVLLTDLTKKVDDLRIKDIFEFKPFSVTSMDLTRGATALTFAKSKPASTPATAGATEVWAQTKPAAKDVNQTAFTDLLNSLSSLRADKFVAQAPAAGDDLIVVARTADAAGSTEEHVTLRKAGGTVYAIRTNEPGAAVVSTADFDKALAQLQTVTSGK